MWTWLAAVASAVTLPLTAAAPNYSAASIVNAANFVSGPLAPNMLATIFGTELSYFTHALGPDDIRGGLLPLDMGSVRVIMAGQAVPLVYVSEKQINFLVPPTLRPGNVTVSVFRQGVYGSPVIVEVARAAPQLFSSGAYVTAFHADSSLISPASPARPGEIVVFYGTGFGPTDPPVAADRELPQLPFPIASRADLTVLLGGLPLDRERVLYCGVTQGFAGLYQLNVRLPDDLRPDPSVQVAIGEQTSPAGLKLPVRLSDQATFSPARTLNK